MWQPILMVFKFFLVLLFALLCVLGVPIASFVACAFLTISFGWAIIPTVIWLFSVVVMFNSIEWNDYMDKVEDFVKGQE